MAADGAVYLDDPLYGPVTIVEPLLIDLLASDAMRRLKHIFQHGISDLVGVTTPITRFDHSLGVMLLVRRLGAGLQEQAAALIHDVSHTAFSHVIDYVFGQHDSQSYHEEVKHAYVAQTDLPAVLARHGIDWQVLLNEVSFPLLEQPAPALCADRLDYFFGDSVTLGLATREQVREALDRLVVRDRRIAVDSLAAARFLAYTFIAADDKSWANLREVGLYEVTARAIRAGLQAGIIDEHDIWTTDAELWACLAQSADPTVQEWLSLVSAQTQFVWDEQHPDWRVSTKIRTIDPDVAIDGSVQPLSKWDPVFAADRAAYIEHKSGLWPIRVVRGTV